MNNSEIINMENKDLHMENSNPEVDSQLKGHAIEKRSRKSLRERLEQKFKETDIKSYEEKDYWDRKTMNGFATIPRVLPITMQILDVLTKGKPIGHTYFCLWARQPDFSFMKIDNPTAFAIEAGFTRERAKDTWKTRMAKLVEYGLIKSYEGHTGPYHYILLRDPVKVMNELNEKGEFQQTCLKHLYARFKERAEEVGASYE
ncbi:hypothetical protein [Snodgrassella sp. ESL0253]|uniref:hypothetical protein n=1 Tax=Snodgrassella sp. ESL0253 TaxID=2705031 RepID=UPI001583923B|nr:hypothetical protein [Snodgrassella sp. ESL0253]NUE67510.1 DUF503 domain-containing protein [Snodgrassella sp. ESL0253]